MSADWRPALAAGLLLGSAALVSPAQAQVFRYMAFGDSITFGTFDNPGAGGYPKRLHDSLNCNGTNCEVVNEGVPGERTTAGVSRIDTELAAGPWDVVLLMEGTNDIFGGLSNNTIESNLETMADKAKAQGVDTVYASIIRFHEDVTTPAIDSQVTDLKNRIRDLTVAQNDDAGSRYFVNAWATLCPTSVCFDTHYVDPGPNNDPVGHPDASGYGALRTVFLDELESQALPTVPSPVGPMGSDTSSLPTVVFDKEDPQNANWYQVTVEDSTGTLYDAWWAEDDFCTETQCTLDTGLTLPAGDYTWRVRGRSPRGRTAWVDTNFTVAPVAPGVPSPTSPAGATGASLPSFSWLREVPTSATSYRVQVEDSVGTVLADETYDAATECDATTCNASPLTQPLAIGDYVWRVRGSNDVGDGLWSGDTAFSITASVFTDGFETGDTSAWSSTVTE